MTKNKKQNNTLPVLNYNDYISEEALDALNVLEGHDKAEDVINTKTKKKERTGLYGIKQDAIDEVKKRIAEDGRFSLTPEMAKVNKPDDLDETTARQYAGYYAWVNTNKLDANTNNKFSELNSHQKDVLLTYFHNIGMKGVVANKGKTGSILTAIENHDIDDIVLSMFTKSDGTYASYEQARKEDKRGVMNRHMLTAEWFYDPYHMGVNSVKDRDAFYNEVYPQKGYVDKLITISKNMKDIRFKNRNIDAMADYDLSLPKPKESEQPVAEPKTPVRKDFGQTLMDMAKNAFNFIVGQNSAPNNQFANMPENMLNKENGAK